MMRLAILFGLVAGPLAAQSALVERPGRWIALPEASGGALEPVASGPLANGSPDRPVIELVAPGPGPALNPAPDALVTADAARAPVQRPATLPVPRPVAVVPSPEAMARDEMGLATWEPGEPGEPGEAMEIAVEVAGRAAPPVQNAATAAPRLPVPVVAVEVAAIGGAGPLLPMAAVLLPDAPGGWRPVPQPSGVAVPRPDPASVLSRPRPPAPAAIEAVRRPAAPWSAPQSAVLLPQMPSDPPNPPDALRWTRAAVPGPDLFPASALPPGSLPDGPEAATRAIQPPTRWAEPMAAVLVSPPVAGLIPVAAPGLPDMPVRDAAPVSPDAPIRLPEPSGQAVARMIDDAVICWRMADLSPEARWAEITVDVALDETNMPAEASIRLTGFRGVVSGAAAGAYRAARSALAGCAEATGAAPATETVALVFDRSGIRLR